MLLPQLLIIAKTLLSRIVISKFAMEAVAIVTVSKLLMFQTENFVIFINYGDLGVILSNYPNESDQILSETVTKGSCH